MAGQRAQAAANAAEDLICYGLATADAFADLRDVVTRLAGILMLRALGRRSAELSCDMLHGAELLFARAAYAVASARPPARARHHHVHLNKALAAAGAALEACRAPNRLDPSVDAALRPLGEAWRQLAFAAAALPGVEVTSVHHTCCSEHAQMRTPIAKNLTKEHLE